MLQFLYSQCFRLLLPFVLARLWWQGRRLPGANKHWQQRLGFIRTSGEPVLWVHAVSVGETIAAGPLIMSLLKRQPGLRILVTAMTATGADQAKSMFGDKVCYAYSPYDTPGAVRRFVKRARPVALVIMETELWPNLIREVHSRQCPVFLVNARLSARSAKGYEKIGRWIRSILCHLDWIAAQAEEDAERFRRLGADAGSVSVTGSIKFDVTVPDSLRAQSRSLREVLGQRPVWIAASTHEGEDEQLLAAHKEILTRIPDALLLIVPRHPERFDAVFTLAERAGFSVARRSLKQSTDGAQVYLGDTMGELLLLYGACDVAFVGGSLIDRGGHNPLEPAACGVGVVTGPHVFNFETIYQQLEKGRGVVRVENGRQLGKVVGNLLDNTDEARLLGQAALAVVEANRGALNQVVGGILDRLGSSDVTPADKVSA